MMKKSFAIATFLGVAGAGGVGVYAASPNSNFSFHGSDTLFTITQELLTPTAQNGNAPLCSGAVGLTYLGGGSGTGETGLVNAAQNVAPMSRFLQASTALCAAVAADGFQAQGLVFALDGLGVFAGTVNGGVAACNGSGSTNLTCTPTTPNVGLVYDKPVTETGFGGATYTFNGWRDVLKVLFTGAAHTGAPAADQGCNGNIRQFLAANYGSVFEVANCTTGCTQIRHLLRRDDSSGTTDAFSQLIGAASPNNTTNQVGPFFLGKDAFCNAFHSTNDTTASTAGASVQAQLPVVSGATVSYQNVVPYDYQDNDPIRRTCAGTGVTPQRTANPNENVCEPDGALPTKTAGTLGLLLAVADTNQAGVILFGPGLACTGGFILVQAPTVPSYNSAGRASNISATCPNGDDPSGGNCFVPTDANGNPNCVADQNTNGAPIVNTAPANGLKPGNVDGRVYNKWVYNFVQGGGVPTVATDNTNNGSSSGGQRPIMGAYYRLHQTLTMNNPDNTGTCAQPDATDQIGCLVGASPCSLGYAGRKADQQAGTTALLVNAIPPTDTCVQQFAYPISRKLYLNTFVGYPSSGGVSGQELELAKCEANGGTITAPGISKAIADNNYVALPSTGANAINGGQPFAEDFNEKMLCDAGTNNLAPDANVGLPNVYTTCGNAVKEAFEDCDNGIAGTSNAIAGGNIINGPPGSCSLTCRLQ